MPYWKGEKWACYSCTKGHRSSKCTHYDRILYKVRKPGRPLNSCPHVLPDSIPPGTFVNTSSESMANGQPPNEACNCKNELVQVAIPKVKSCSCLTAGSSATHPPHSSDPSEGLQSGGHANKHPGTKRKINGAEDESAGAERAEEEVALAQASPPLKAERPVNAAAHGAFRTPCADPTWEAFDVLYGPVSVPSADGKAPDYLKRLVRRDDPPADPEHPFGPTMNEKQSRRFITPSSPSARANSRGSSSSASPSSAKLRINGSAIPPQSTFTDDRKRPSSYPNSLDLKTLGYAGVAQEYFAHTKRPKQRQRANPGDSGESALHSPPPSMGFRVPSRVTADLSVSEWNFILQARTTGLDLSELSKAIYNTWNTTVFANQATVLGSNDPSGSLLKATPMNVALSSRSSTTLTDDAPNPGSKESSHSQASPTPQRSDNFNFPNNQNCCAKQPSSSGVTQVPDSPRCKCGDACRCVPCADHPHNPAMVAHIKANMEHMGTPGGFSDVDQSSLHSSFPTLNEHSMYNFFNDDDEMPTNSTIGDFNDFVICDYKYMENCAEGVGGCKCGEGCTCIGCLTHGGHDGVPLNIPSGHDTQTFDGVN